MANSVEHVLYAYWIFSGKKINFDLCWWVVFCQQVEVLTYTWFNVLVKPRPPSLVTPILWVVFLLRTVSLCAPKFFYFWFWEIQFVHYSFLLLFVLYGKKPLTNLVTRADVFFKLYSSALWPTELACLVSYFRILSEVGALISFFCMYVSRGPPPICWKLFFPHWMNSSTPAE